MPIIRYRLTKNSPNIHPQLDIQNIGIKILKWEAVSVADCIFMEIDKLPNPMPEYIVETPDWYFSDDRKNYE